MTSSQPYLVRAIYEWIVDNELTPYLLVDASREGVEVPESYMNDQHQIILNISPNATRELQMNNDEITFNARFNGQARYITVPTYSVQAIYAKENGQGMMFNDNEKPSGPGSNDKSGKTTDPKNKPSDGKDKPVSKRPTLKVVK